MFLSDKKQNLRHAEQEPWTSL